MDKNTRTFVNVLAQYVRTAVTVIVSLFITRLVLHALGKSDYGLFMLVGGVVTMLGFLTNAMIVTTQRHLSFYYGKSNKNRVSSIFSNSLFTHIGLGILLFLVLISIMPFLFSDSHKFLNIDAERMDVAKYVYFFSAAGLFVTFITAPFKGMLMAHENIVFISVVEVCDAFLKLVLVLIMTSTKADQLLFYSIILFLVQLLNLLAFSLFANYKYEECILFPKLKYLRINEIKRIFNFAGWTVYSYGCNVFRNQGLNFVYNHFFGTIINAANGLATQVSNSIAFLAQSVLNAFSPRVIKAEGEGDRQAMLRLAGATSKISFLLLSMFAIPLCFEMNGVMNFWLKNQLVPENAVFFSRCVVIASIFDQLTIGLGVANQAIGKIRNYSLVMGTAKIMVVVFAAILLHKGYDVRITMYIYIIIECISAVFRLVYMHLTANLSILEYSKNVFKKCILPTVTLVSVCSLCMLLPDFTYRFCITISSAIIADMLIVYNFGLEKSEKVVFMNLIKRKR